MPKGYWIARVDVRDGEGYKPYAEATRVPFEKYGAVILARGGAYHGVEGSARGRNVVIEFPSLEAAKACFDSPEYKAARALRLPHAEAEIVLVEGV